MSPAVLLTSMYTENCYVFFLNNRRFAKESKKESVRDSQTVVVWAIENIVSMICKKKKMREFITGSRS